MAASSYTFGTGAYVVRTHWSYTFGEPEEDPSGQLWPKFTNVDRPASGQMWPRVVIR